MLVNAGQGICVLGACLVEVCVVSAHVPFPIGLFYHDNVGQPGRLSDLSDKLSFE